MLESSFTLVEFGRMCRSDMANPTLNSDQVLAAFRSLRIDHKSTKVRHGKFADDPLVICTVQKDEMKYFAESPGPQEYLVWCHKNRS
jgi:hypothetical protein